MEVIEGRVANFGEILETHAAIVGRRFAVERVRRFLEENDRGLLVIEGEPGMGKTALIAHLIEEVFGHFAPRPAHFFYRRTAGITDPDVCVKSLYHSLLEAHGITEAEESRLQTTPEQVYNKLVDLLSKLAAKLSPSRPQLIFIDALDEANRDAFMRVPENLPAGVYIVASSRQVAQRTTLARRANLHWFNLDDPDLLQENLRDGHDYIRRELLHTEVPEATQREMARIGGGNFLVLKLLCQHVKSRLTAEEVKPFLQQLATDGSKDQLGFIYEEFWQRLTDGGSREDLNVLCDVAGVLVAAHAPLTGEVICDVLGLRAGDWDFALRRLAEYLTAIEGEEDGVHETFFRVYHESFADFLRAKTAVDKGRLCRRLADYCRGWDERPEGYGRTYALRFGPTHLIEAGRGEDAAAMLLEWRFLEAKTEAGLVFRLVEDLAEVTQTLLKGDERRLLALLEHAVRRDIHFIHLHRKDYPQGLFQCMWNSGWWYDCHEASQYYDLSRRSVTSALPWEREGRRLSELLGRWRREREKRAPGFVWLRSKRPPAVPLNAAHAAILSDGHRKNVISVNYSPDGRHIASGSEDGIVCVWDAVSGERLHRVALPIETTEGAVKFICYSPDGRNILIRLHDGTAKSWNPENDVLNTLPEQPGDVLLCLRKQESARTKAYFSPDGKQVVRELPDYSIQCCDVSSGKELFNLCGHEDPVRCVSYSPDGKHIVTGSADNTVRIWDAEGGEELLCLRGHGHDVTDVSYSPDGRCIVTSSLDGTVRVWGLEGRETSIRLREIEGYPVRANFSRDGQRILAELLLSSANWEYPVRVQEWASESGLCLGTVESSWDDIPLHCDQANQLQWHSVYSHIETAIQNATTGRAIAWFAPGVRPIASHPASLTWAGFAYSSFVLFTLEGRLAD